MTAPAFMTATTLYDVWQALAEAIGSTLDMLPTHAITSIRDGMALDLNRADPWDLKADGGTAIRGESPIGAPTFMHHTMRTTRNAPARWVALRPEAFDFSTQAWSVLFPWCVTERGAGHCFMSKLKGPRTDDIWYPWATNLGADKGWGVTANGDGGFGLMQYGVIADPGGAVPTKADPFGWHNNDVSPNTYAADDGRWRMFEVGYSPEAKTSWLTVAKRGSEGGGVKDVLCTSSLGAGDMHCPDELFTLGFNYYGARIAGQTGAVGLPLIAFEGAAAINRFATRAQSLPALQAQIEAAGG